MITKPRLSVVDGRLVRERSRFMGIDIAKSGAWALTVMEKAPNGQLLVVNNARGMGKTYAMNAALEMMRQYKINEVYREAALRMWAPTKIGRMFYD